VARLTSADVSRLAGRTPGSKWDPDTGQPIDEEALQRQKIETERAKRQKREADVADAKRRYADRKKERAGATAAAAAPSNNSMDALRDK
jgi:hypothetical protein